MSALGKARVTSPAPQRRLRSRERHRRGETDRVDAVRIVQYPRHGPVPAGALPDLAREALALEQGVGGPGWGGEEVGPVQVGIALQGWLEAAIQVVRRTRGE